MAGTRKVIGVDIGATGVRVAQVASATPGKDGFVDVPRIAFRALPAGAVSEGRVSNRKQVVAALNAALADIKGSRHSPLAVAVAGKHTALKWVSIPLSFKPDERVQFVRRNLKTLSPSLTPGDAAISLMPMRPSADGRHMLCAVAGLNKTWLAKFQEVMRDGVRGNLAVLDLTASALLRAYVRPSADDAAIIADVGASQTVVALRRGPDLMWVESIAGGTDTIRTALSTRAEINEDEAERLITQLVARDVDVEAVRDGLGPNIDAAAAVADDDLFDDIGPLATATRLNPDAVVEAEQTEILTSAVDEICDGIAKAIEEHQGDATHVPPAGVSLVGRGSMVRGMNARLAQRTGLPAHGALPLTRIPVNSFTRQFAQLDPTASRERHHIPPAVERQFAVAVGMALTPII